MQHKLFVLKQSLKETHSFAPSFNLRRANPRRANLKRASGDPPSFKEFHSVKVGSLTSQKCTDFLPFYQKY